MVSLDFNNDLKWVACNLNMSLSLSDLDYSDPLASTYRNPWKIVFFINFTLVIECFGNLLLFGIMVYEKYGVDPRKRTVVNVLLSQLALTTIFGNVLVFSFAAWRYLFGPLGN